jgi:hypothetical protein
MIKFVLWWGMSKNRGVNYIKFQPKAGEKHAKHTKVAWCPDKALRE